MPIAAVAAGGLTPQAVVVLVPTDAFFATLPDDVSIPALSAVPITLFGEHPDLLPV